MDNADHFLTMINGMENLNSGNYTPDAYYAHAVLHNYAGQEAWWDDAKNTIRTKWNYPLNLIPGISKLTAELNDKIKPLAHKTFDGILEKFSKHENSKVASEAKILAKSLNANNWNHNLFVSDALKLRDLLKKIMDEKFEKDSNGSPSKESRAAIQDALDFVNKLNTYGNKAKVIVDKWLESRNNKDDK